MVSTTLIMCAVVLTFLTFLLLYNQWLARKYATERKREMEKLRREETDLMLSNAGEECVYSACSSGLTCDPDTLTCRRAKGAPCSVTEECVIGTFCSGVCIDSDVNSLHSPCPCKSPFTCTKISEENTFRCLKIDGEKCSKNADCSGGVCFKGVCDSRKGLASYCSKDGECSSGNCSLNVCQDRGIVTHARNSACNLGVPNDVAYCGQGHKIPNLPNRGCL